MEWLPQEILPGLDVDEVPSSSFRRKKGGCPFLWSYGSNPSLPGLPNRHFHGRFVWLGFPVPPTEAAYGPQQAAAYEVDNKKSEAFYSEAGRFDSSVRWVEKISRLSAAINTFEINGGP